MDLNKGYNLNYILANMQENLVFYAWWADYEEDGWIVIFERGGVFFYQEGGYCVMNINHEEIWHPQPISQEEALQLMLEWAEHEDDSATLEEIKVGFGKRNV